jgi:hypothetical protein
MAKGRLPEGYISAQDLIKKFRKENPKAEISTAAQLLTAGEEAIIVVTASVSTGEAKSSGMSQGLLLDDKATEKAESSAIRRALVNLGYDSVESEDEAEEKEEKQEKKEKKESRFGKAKREEPKEEEAEEDDEAEEEEEEKPRSRFGGKAAKEESEEEEESEEGQSRFKRGSRFQRS